MTTFDEKLARVNGREELRFSWSSYQSELEQMMYAGNAYPLGLNMTNSGTSVEAPVDDFGGYVAGMKACPPAYAAQRLRAKVIGGTRFIWRATREGSEPGRLFGNRDLRILERPWPHATTRDLTTRMEWHVGAAGNAYALRTSDRLHLLNPAWVQILYSSDREPDMASWAIDGELAGYLYTNGGDATKATPQLLRPDQVVHWAPDPDPQSPERGMSWLTPVLREIQADKQTTEFKLKFFAQGATPNLVVKGIKGEDGRALDRKQFSEIVATLEKQHAGIRNAGRTLYLAEGADATVVGANLKDADLSTVQGKLENRIAVASQVPATILLISEAFQGSGLQQGFAQAAKRNFIDFFYTPHAESLASAFQHILPAPDGGPAELSFDPKASTFLQEDRQDEAEILNGMLTAISTGIAAGFEADQVVDAVVNGDLKTLKGSHSGLTSVQLQPPQEGNE